MNLERALKEFGSKLAEEADVRAVFGDPLKLGGRTIIPVAVVDITLGGAGGGSAKLSAVPVGWLCEVGGRVVFERIVLSPGAGRPARRKR